MFQAQKIHIYNDFIVSVLGVLLSVRPGYCDVANSALLGEVRAFDDDTTQVGHGVASL